MDRKYSLNRNEVLLKTSVEPFKIEDLITSLNNLIPIFKNFQTRIDVNQFTRGSWIIKKTKAKKLSKSDAHFKAPARRITSHDDACKKNFLKNTLTMGSIDSKKSKR